jgi:hypothetical protein
VTKAAAELVARLTAALGTPSTTPERVMGAGGSLERAGYRVFRWRCPACRGGHDDPGHRLGHVVIGYRPLVVDSDGRMVCEAGGCSVAQIVAAAWELAAA